MLDRIENLFIDVATAAIILLALMIFADVIALNLFSRARAPQFIVAPTEIKATGIAARESISSGAMRTG